MTATRRKHFIRDWMMVRNETIRSLAKKAKVSTTTVSRIREGEGYQKDSFTALCRALRITEEEAYVNPYDRLQQTLTPGRSTDGSPPRRPRDYTIKEWLDDPNAMLDDSTPASEEFKTHLRTIYTLWLNSEKQKKK